MSKGNNEYDKTLLVFGYVVVVDDDFEKNREKISIVIENFLGKHN
jgi:hypothetical protein